MQPQATEGAASRIDYEITYYDKDQALPVSSEIWSRGDDPMPGRAHIEIYACGRLYGNPIDRETGQEREFEGVFELDHQGNYPISNPEHNREPVDGLHVSSMHDGHIQVMHWQAFFLFTPYEEELRHALKGARHEACVAVQNAKRRAPKVCMVSQRGVM